MRLFSLYKKGLFSTPIVVFIAVLSIALSVFLQTNPVAAADTNLDNDTNAGNIFKGIKYYHAVEYCASTGAFKTTVSGDDINKGPRWWINSSRNITIGEQIDKWGDKNGQTGCAGESDETPGWVEDVFTLIGIDPNGGEASLEKLGYKCSINNGTRECKKDNINSSILGILKNSTYYKGTSVGNTSSDIYKVASYWGALTGLKGSCEAKKGGNTNLQTLSIVQSDGSIKKEDWSIKNASSQYYTGVSPLDDMLTNKDVCKGSLATALNDNAGSYQVWVGKATCRTSYPDLASDTNKLNWCAKGWSNNTNPGYCISPAGIVGYSAGQGYDFHNACFLGAGHPTDANGKTAGELCMAMFRNDTTLTIACINGATHKNNPSYCNATYPAPDNLNGSGQLPKDTNKEKREACNEGFGLDVNGGGAAPSADPSVSDDPDAEESSTCVIEGIGWAVCPITNFLAGITDASFSVIKNFLVVRPELFNTESGTYSAWSAFRNIANVAFVIVFLIIIFSQLTGQGVSNYGIKKTLPRLVIAAILVNISYFVCQLAVDASQILGVSIRDILKNVPIGSGDASVMSWTDVMGDVLMGTGIAALAIAGAAAGVAILTLSISLPVLLAALLAILLTVIILVGRQAAVVILIVLSPLAFVAFLLPNTEQWFKKWYKIFIALLLVFPTVALLYGGGELASKIISSAANSGNTAGDMKFWLNITAIAVAAVPLIMTPALLKGALNGLGSVGAKISGFASKANGRVRSTANASSRYGEAKQGLKNRFALSRAARRGKSSFQQAIDRSPVGRSLGLDKGAARAANIVAREDDAEVDAEVARIKLNTNSVNRLDEAQRMLEEGIKTGNTTQARAAQRILLGSGNAGISKVQAVYSKPEMQEHMGKPQADGTMKELRSDLNGAGLKGKNNALATYGYQDAKDANGKSLGHQSFNAHLGAESTYSSLNPVELAGQSSGNLERARASITPSMAQAVLSNSGASALLDGTKRDFFEQIAGTATGTATGTTQAQATTAPTQTESLTGQQAGAGPTARSTTAPTNVIPSSGGVFAGDSQGTISIEHPRSNTQPTQSGTPAGQATITTNEHGQMGVAGQHEDTIDRMSR